MMLSTEFYKKVKKKHRNYLKDYFEMLNGYIKFKR